VALRDEDIKLLKRTIEFLNERSQDAEHFANMLIGLEEGRWGNLTTKQRQWAKSVLDEPEYENLVSSGKAPRGREVPTPSVLRNLPLKPPGRR
jgi:hypothetical protein